MGLRTLNLTQVQEPYQSQNPASLATKTKRGFNPLREIFRVLQGSLVVTSFLWKGQRCSVLPPLLFKCNKDNETGMFELIGTGVYEDLRTYGETLSEAIEALQEGVLPVLCEDYINRDSLKLTRRAEEMAVDFGSRIDTPCL